MSSKSRFTNRDQYHNLGLSLSTPGLVVTCMFISHVCLHLVHVSGTRVSHSVTHLLQVTLALYVSAHLPLLPQPTRVPVTAAARTTRGAMSQSARSRVTARTCVTRPDTVTLLPRLGKSVSTNGRIKYLKQILSSKYLYTQEFIFLLCLEYF